MFRRGSQVFSLLALVVLLCGLFPLGVAAQFPSQQQAPPEGQGGFPSQGGGRGGFYQGPSFGGSLTWGPEWELQDQSTEQGFDFVAVSNGTSLVAIGWSAMDITPQDAVMNLANGLGGGSWIFDEAVVDETDRAAAYFNEAQGQAAHLIIVDRLDQQTGRFIIWDYPASQYETEFDAFTALLGGLA
jgi:hypothetical protein